MKKRLITILMVIGLATVLTACGSSYLSEWPGEASGEDYVEIDVRITAEAEGHMQGIMPDLSLSKDAGGRAEVDFEEGGVGKATDELILKCNVLSTLTDQGTGLFTAGGIEVIEDPADYPAECDTESNCVLCYNRWAVLNDQGQEIPDEFQAHCIYNCTGVVAQSLLENDWFPTKIEWIMDLDTTAPAAGEDMLFWSGGAPLPTPFEADISDVVTGIYVDTSDDYDLTRCDGAGDPEEMTVILTDPASKNAYSDNGGAGPITWAKGLDITDHGAMADGVADCAITVHEEGDLLVSVDMTEEGHFACVNYCNLKSACADFCAGDAFSAQEMELMTLAYVDVSNNPQDLDGASGVPLNYLYLEFNDEPMIESSINRTTVLLEFDNIHADMLQTEVTNVVNFNDGDAFADDSFVLELAEPRIDYQFHSGVLMVYNVLAQSGKILHAPLVADNFSIGPAMGDNFFVDSNTAYTWNTTINNEPNAIDANYDTWAEIGPGAAGILAYNITGNDDYLAYVGDNGGAADVFVRATKLTDAVKKNCQIEVDLTNVGDFDSVNAPGGIPDIADADSIRFGIVNASYDGYLIGVQAWDLNADGAPWETIAFFVQVVAGAVVNGSMYDISAAGSNIILELTQYEDGSATYAYISLDSGASFIDMQDGNNPLVMKYDGATNMAVTHAGLAGELHVISEFFSRADVAATDSTANIQSMRAYGIKDAQAAPEFTWEEAWEGNIGTVGP